MCEIRSLGRRGKAKSERGPGSKGIEGPVEPKIERITYLDDKSPL